MEPCKPHQLDQDVYAHWPGPGRARWRPHGDARIALVIYLYLERFEAQPLNDAVFDRRFFQGFARRPPYHRLNAMFEYGNRVGIFRILDLLDKHGLRASVAANTAAVTAYPYLVAQFRRRNFEFLGHGQYASRMITSAMPEAEQRQVVVDALDTLERAVGRRPTGWLSQDYGQSPALPHILAREGVQFICDYSHDEDVHLTTTDPKLVSIPNPSEWNDAELLIHRKVTSEDHARSVTDAFDCLYAEGAASTKVFGLHIHPWVLGLPARFPYLEKMVAHLAGHAQVWNATAGDVAATVQR